MFRFVPCDPDSNGKFLAVDPTKTGVRCITNSRQQSQGTVLISVVGSDDDGADAHDTDLQPLARGTTSTLVIRCNKKPGRMRYFIGVCPVNAFSSLAAGSSEIASKSFSLEALKSKPNKVGEPCQRSGLPGFHAGSTVVMQIEYSADGRWMRVGWHVDSTDVDEFVEADLMKLGIFKEQFCPFVSLYNKDAEFELVESSQSVLAADKERNI
ncbi:unnamed protein product [Polarella glacialis]|uniref:Uncharacterized protein n=1 Tax=Polarella glacialis TaxID=89957 RepID=A0A813D832_POLGL|nr:unnamed protein product [Polarella glacialis]CAE8743696.1 unnamed protein product [Polarella glacialis]